jgi:hypothetical protein
METLPKLERVRRLTMMPGMKLVCMSDMHRGDSSTAAPWNTTLKTALPMSSWVTPRSFGRTITLIRSTSPTHRSTSSLQNSTIRIRRRPGTSRYGGIMTCTGRTMSLSIARYSLVSRPTRVSSWRQGSGRVAVSRPSVPSCSFMATRRTRSAAGRPRL